MDVVFMKTLAAKAPPVAHFSQRFAPINFLHCVAGKEDAQTYLAYLVEQEVTAHGMCLLRFLIPVASQLSSECSDGILRESFLHKIGWDGFR
jgi:hypothetical protein